MKWMSILSRLKESCLLSFMKIRKMSSRSKIKIFKKISTVTKRNFYFNKEVRKILQQRKTEYLILIFKARPLKHSWILKIEWCLQARWKNQRDQVPPSVKIWALSFSKHQERAFSLMEGISKSTLASSLMIKLSSAPARWNSNKIKSEKKLWI